jgi:hypothetical protein
MADDDVLEELLRQEAAWDAPVAARWGTYVKAFLACALLLLAGGAATNAVVNPRGEFPVHVLPPAPWEDAAYKVYLLDGKHPDVLVLGSSRMQKIDPKEVERETSLTAFNFALAGTQPSDSLRVLEGLAERGQRPREVIVGLDVNRIEPHASESNRTQYAFGPLHRPGATWLDVAAAAARSYSFLYLRDSAVSLWHVAGLSLPQADEVAFEPDGLAHYVPWETAERAGTFDRNASITKAIGPGGYHAYGGLDPAQVAAIQRLVAEARAANATVRLVVTPVHHRLEDAYGTYAYPLARQAVVDLTRSLCQPGVHAYNYTRAANFGGNEEGFYDGVHYDAANAARIVQGVYSGRGDLCM